MQPGRQCLRDADAAVSLAGVLDRRDKLGGVGFHGVVYASPKHHWTRYLW